MYPQRNTLTDSSSRALTLHTLLQIGSSCREFSSLFSVTGGALPEFGPVKPHSHRAALRQQESGKRSESLAESTGSGKIGGPVRSIRGSWLYLDHQVSLWSWTGEREIQQKKGRGLVFFVDTFLTVGHKDYQCHSRGHDIKLQAMLTLFHCHCHSMSMVQLLFFQWKSAVWI